MTREEVLRHCFNIGPGTDPIAAAARLCLATGNVVHLQISFNEALELNIDVFEQLIEFLDESIDAIHGGR